MNAIIFSNDKNTDMCPMTCEVPKMMVPVSGVPAIEILIRRLVKSGVLNISVVTGDMSGEIIGYIGDGKWLGAENVTYYSYCKSHALKSISECFNELAGEEVIAITESTYFYTDINSVLEFHRSNGKIFTAAVKQNGEKSHIREVGIYVFSRYASKWLSRADSERCLKELAGLDMRAQFVNDTALYLVKNECFDFKNLNEYIYANQFAAENFEITDEGRFLEQGIFVGVNSIISENVKLTAPVFIGSNCMIEGNCEISGSIIGRGSIVGCSTNIKDSVCWNNVSVGKNVVVENSLICSSAKLEKNVTAKGCVIGNRAVCHIASAVLNNVKIWPDSVVEAGCIVRKDVIEPYEDLLDFDEDCMKAESCKSKTVTETVSRLGSTMGTFFGPASTVIIGNDSENTSVMLTLAVAAGLLESGVKVKVVKDSILPVMRWICRQGMADGGIFISSKNGTEFNVINTHGNDLSQNERSRIQKIYIKNEFTSAGEDAVGEFGEMSNPEEYYTAAISGIFPEAYRKLRLGTINCNREKREAVTASVISKLYKDAPLFVSVSSSLSAESIAKKNMKKVVRCGANRGDVMYEMEKYMDIPGVYQQYLMLYDDFAFELAVCHFEAITGVDPMKNTDFPNVFRKNVYVECKPNKKSDIYRQILENDYIRRNFDRDDGLVNFSDSGCIRIIPDEVRPRIRITVESFDEEYAEDMADRFTKIVSEYADE